MTRFDQATASGSGPAADPSIAVGLGGADGWQAMAWAAEEAELTGARLVVLRVCAPGSPLARTAGAPTPAEVELSDPPLAQACARLRARLGGQRIDLRIRDGDPSDRLAEVSAGVGLLVIGAGEGGRTVRRVLRHAHSPVVVVRPETPAAEGQPFAGHVVVGVDGTPAGRAATEFAFAYAHAHHLPVAAVHVSEAGTDDYFYDDTMLSTHFTVEPAALEPLAAETEPFTRTYRGVTLRRAVLHGPVAGALTGAAPHARLLVIGDKRRGPIGRVRTGDIPLTVASQAACPVAVVAPPDHRPAAPHVDISR